MIPSATQNSKTSLFGPKSSTFQQKEDHLKQKVAHLKQKQSKNKKISAYLQQKVAIAISNKMQNSRFDPFYAFYLFKILTKYC